MTWVQGVGEPAQTWSVWNPDPLVLLGVILIAALYGRGVRRLWEPARGRAVGRARVMAFYAGLVALLIALVSPLDALAHDLFSAHMVQHLVMILVAAPLLIYGAPQIPIPFALPLPARRRLHALGASRSGRRVARALLALPVVWLIHAAALWAWHLPALYESALESEFMHALEHVSFLGSALLFWTLVIGSPRRRALDRAPAAGLVFITALQSGALGVVLTFAESPLYPQSVGARGMDALADQQLAGAIMWVPPGVVYLATIAVLLFRWLEDMDARSEPWAAPLSRGTER